MRPRKASNKITPEKQEAKKDKNRSHHTNLNLASKNKRDFTSNARRLPEREIDFVQSDDGSLVEFIEDAVDPSRTRFAVSKNGRVRFTDHFEHGGEMFLPISRATLGLSEVKLPRGTLPYRLVIRL